ncbi:hypothetical protein MD484_g1004, partial [Candolleomyces efflorescens]
MTSDSRPKKAVTARDLQALATADPSLAGGPKLLGPSSGRPPAVPPECPEQGPGTALGRRFNVGGNIHIHSSQHLHNAREQSIDGWKTLLENISPNAFYNSEARFDPPKCDEDTRVEVIGEIMDWMNDREGPQRLLCMTGAAGAGKSALQQTVAERCANSGTLAVAFFFSSQDPSRNDISKLIPTIAFQLGQKDPALQDNISRAIEADPPIFKRSIRTQMDTLIVRPFKQLCATPGFDPGGFPHAILIDGLDECSGEEKQAELLSSIKHCFLDNDLPFRIFIASRPEWAIRSALRSEPPGYLHPLAYHIQLSDKYDATKDIRRYLWRRLQAIGRESHDRRAHLSSWPSVEDVEKLVQAASGQFVFAATVVKYVSERRSSPVERLQTVINWTPDGGQVTRPFEALDILYTGILTKAKESYEAVDTNRGRNFLLLLKAHQMNSDGRVGGLWFADLFDEILGLENGAHEDLAFDLHSLVAFHHNTTSDGSVSYLEMRFYHRSFSEFMDSETRAKSLFVPEILVKEYVLEVTLHGIDGLSLEPSKIDATSSSLLRNEALLALVLYSDKGEILSGQQILASAQNDGWKKFDYLLLRSNFSSIIFSKFPEMIFVFIRRLKNELEEPGLADVLESYYDKWRTLRETRGYY